MPRCTGSAACSTVAPIRVTWRVASCAWPGKTSAWPTRARRASRSTPPRPSNASALPEGELALAEAVLYLAMAAKSNAAYLAYNAARSFISGDGSRPVPVHLRNAPTRLMKNLGYGKDYRYAHDEADAYAAGETYFPEACRRSSGIDRSRVASRSGLARSWRSCASSIARQERKTSRRTRPSRTIIASAGAGGLRAGGRGSRGRAARPPT
jgi:hypothetical protein